METSAITQEPVFLVLIATLGQAVTEWLKNVGAARQWILPTQLAPLINMLLVTSAGLVAWILDGHNQAAFVDTVTRLLAASALGQAGHNGVSTARKRRQATREPEETRAIKKKLEAGSDEEFPTV